MINLRYALPNGIIKLISSANAPQAARFAWNMVIHVPKPIAHTDAPIADKYTSEISQK